MNSCVSKYKRSKIELETNRQIIYMVIAQVIFCFGCAVIGTIHEVDMEDYWYLKQAGDMAE